MRDHEGKPGDVRPWYEVAFGELYPILYSHRDEDSAAAEVSFVCKTLGLTPKDRVLDLACGAGRHLRSLAHRGIRTVGIDLSSRLLAAARTVEEKSRLVRGDMRALPFGESTFDAVLSFFTSFGYFSSDDDDRRVLREVCTVLRENGRYVLDFLHAETVRRTLVPTSHRVAQRHHIAEHRRIDQQRVCKTVVVENPEGEEVLRYEESVRLYEPDELRGMLEDAGLSVVKTYGALDGRPFGDGPRVVFMSRPAR